LRFLRRSALPGLFTGTLKFQPTGLRHEYDIEHAIRVIRDQRRTISPTSQDLCLRDWAPPPRHLTGSACEVLLRIFYLNVGPEDAGSEGGRNRANVKFADGGNAAYETPRSEGVEKVMAPPFDWQGLQHHVALAPIGFGPARPT
jgi:hypothetical protein